MLLKERNKVVARLVEKTKLSEADIATLIDQYKEMEADDKAREKQTATVKVKIGKALFDIKGEEASSEKWKVYHSYAYSWKVDFPKFLVWVFKAYKGGKLRNVLLQCLSISSTKTEKAVGEENMKEFAEKVKADKPKMIFSEIK